MVCRDFILPEPASYVFFYAIFNLRNLLYIIISYSNASDPIKEAPHCQSLHRTTAARVRATLTAERAV